MNKSIKIIPFPEIENAYIVISAIKAENGNNVRHAMTFLYDGKNGQAIEWEPDYGPITRLTQCKESDEDAEPHWFFPFYTGHGNWSQLGVEKSGLPYFFLKGDYKALFSAMKEWLR
jgi:hypothetical protein